VDAQRGSRAQALYVKAEGLPAEARTAFLDDACGGDAALRAEVEALLKGDAETRAATRGAAEEEPPSQPGGEREDSLGAGTLLGPWRIERRVGRGGMGEVYEAQRADGAFELRAAVKLLKRGLDTDAVVARFNRERRILAQLDHANIAHVLDAGVAPDGRPFLVMEYVEGRPITEYVRDQVLPMNELLQLLITVCEAVQAAHAKRIVHRDLKPSNVLVTPQGQVKLLDFGIAKALAEEDANVTHLAGEASAMTPAYAAPEQFLGAPATPATDVYALGVILYQLLVDRLPHARGGRTTHDIVRTLDQETIERPSTVLRKDRGRLPESLRLARLKSASGDLDLVVLKALHAEASRRYADARALADDLRRLLDHRPIQARPDSSAYRVGRFIRRNRVPVAAAGAVILALTLGLTAALWQAKAAILARNDATQRRQQADDLINFMLGDLKDRLDEVGRLDVLDTTISKAVGYIGGGDPRQLDNEALAQRIAVLNRVGEIQVARGQASSAIASGHAAVDAARELQGRQPGARSEQLLADAMHHLADADDLADDSTSSRLLWKQISELTQHLLVAQPRNPDLILLAAKYDEQVAGDADYGEQHSKEVGDAHWRACIDRLRPLAGQPGVKPQLVGELILCERRWVVHLFNFSDFDGARQAAATFVAEAETFSRQYESVAFVQDDLVQSLSAVAAALARMGQAEAALRPSALAMEIGRKLTALEPGNVAWLHSYASAVLFDTDVKTRLKNWADAQADADEALVLFHKVLEHTPDDYSARMEAMQLRGMRADLDAARDRKDLAVGETTLGLALQREDDQSAGALINKLHLLLKQWLYALDSQPDVVRSTREAALRLLDNDPSKWLEASLLDSYRTDALYLGGQCAEGDRIRDRMLAGHNPYVSRLQKFRDAGCGQGGAARKASAPARRAM